MIKTASKVVEKLSSLNPCDDGGRPTKRRRVTKDSKGKQRDKGKQRADNEWEGDEGKTIFSRS